MADSPNMAPTPSILGGLPLAASQMQAAPAAAMPMQQSADPLTAQALSRLSASQQMIDQMQQLRQQSAAIPLPQTSVMQAPWMKMQSPAGKGFLGGLGTVMADVGRGALAGVAATAPGRAVQQGVYGPGERRYAMQKGNIAQQIQGLQEGAQLEQQPVAPLGELAYHKALVGEKERHDVSTEDIARQRADTAARAVTNRYSMDLKNIQLKTAHLGLDQQNLALKQWYDKGLLEAMNSRTSAGMNENDARISAQEDMRAAMQGNQWAIQHPFLNAMGLNPTIEGAPGAAMSPVTPGQPSQTRAAAPKASKGGQMIFARDPKGKLHSAPAGTALPKGWTTEKR